MSAIVVNSIWKLGVKTLLRLPVSEIWEEEEIWWWCVGALIEVLLWVWGRVKVEVNF